PMVEVVDLGRGMSAQQRMQVLSPTSSGPRPPADEGSGLGLRFCRVAAELHDAEVCVETELGVGSTFRVTFS
ncbi:MAG: ATP-binding protein, partial [Myxococcota bacterium]